MLDLDAQKYEGGDLTNLVPEEMSDNQRVFCIHWYMCAMVLKPSPNHTTQAIFFAEDFLLGNTQIMRNTFQYSSVCINLPGKS